MSLLYPFIYGYKGGQGQAYLQGQGSAHTEKLTPLPMSRKLRAEFEAGGLSTELKKELYHMDPRQPDPQSGTGTYLVNGH